MNAGYRKGMIVFCLLMILAGCDYARMTSDDGYDTYETHLPIMPTGSVPISGGASAVRLLGAEFLQNPLPQDEAHWFQGRRNYGHFCIHCHGTRGDGLAAVGQSFAPLPTDLGSPRVQAQNDGQLFYTIAFGLRRHPPLIDTMMARDIWAVMIYLRSEFRAENDD
jgi:hypothetical protein